MFAGGTIAVPFNSDTFNCPQRKTASILHVWCTPSIRFALQYPERVQRHAHPAVRRRCKCRQLHGVTASFQGRSIHRL